MNVDSITGVFLVLVNFVFGIIGFGFVVEDYRLYESVYKNCEKYGFIQNDNTRIYCRVEDKNETKNFK